MQKHKGQAMVEFALILPLFLFMVYGIIYFGMLFHDYSSLSNIARSCAREAAITETLDEAAIQSIKNRYTQTSINQLWTSLYKLNNENDFTISENSTTKEISVTIKMTLSSAPVLLSSVLPETFDIVYFMRKDS